MFGSTDTGTATERLIVLAETRSKDAEEREKLRIAINTLATDLVGAPPDEVVLAPPATVLKTSSGKIRRAASRELFEKGEIGKRRRSMPWQVTRLALSAVIPQIRRTLNTLSVKMYAAYCWLVFALLAPVTWLCVWDFHRFRPMLTTSPLGAAVPVQRPGHRVRQYEAIALPGQAHNPGRLRGRAARGVRARQLDSRAQPQFDLQ